MTPTAEMTAQRAAGETQNHHAGIIMPRRTSRLTKKRAGFRRPSYAYAYATRYRQFTPRDANSGSPR